MTPFFEICFEFAVDSYIEYVDSVITPQMRYMSNLTPEWRQMSYDPNF